MRKALATAVLVLTALLGISGVASATGGDVHKVWICKYVGKPFVDERVQTGQNPIDVDVSAIPEHPVEIGSYFADRQGRSFVLAWDTGQPDPDVSECPAPTEPTTTTQPEVTTTTAPTTTAPETTTSSPDTTPTTAPCTEPRGCPPPPQPTNPDGSLRLGGPDGSPDGAQPLPTTGRSSGALAGFAVGLLGVGLAMARRFRFIRNDGSNHE